MAGKTRPSLRTKTLQNVDHSNLSITDKECIHQVFERYEKLTTADVVEVDTLKDWLLELAKNNVGCVIDGNFSEVCIDLISRLDGLRRFAQERRDT